MIKLAVLSLDYDLCHLQRCKHFEIGGDTKKKNQVRVNVCCGGCRHVKCCCTSPLLLYALANFPV